MTDVLDRPMRAGLMARAIDAVIEPFAPVSAMRRKAARAAIAQLSMYQGADRGRRNNDRVGARFNNGSADLAIIPDGRTLNARARQLLRDSWIAASAVKAMSSNIVCAGITTVPAAHDADDKALDAFNRKAERLFGWWGTVAENCDLEKRQTWAQKQALLVEERYTVGESFLVWSYTPPKSLAEPVGLRFQTFEAEMLDLTKQSYGQNEVRGGIELDDNGAPVAYHFWTRNPSDYLFRRQMHSVRIPAARVLHYFKQERVLQTRGVTPFAPVMQTLADYDRYQSASLWSAIMQACIGMVITKNLPTGPLSSPLGLAAAPGDTGTTASGMRKVDFTPGMAPELAPGEDVKFLNPNQPGNQYEPFSTVTLRGIAAGFGISYGLLCRHFDGNYSAARQDMLEDNRRVDAEQLNLISRVNDPLYRLFIRFAVLEGRFDGVEGFSLGEFLLDERRYTKAEYVPPPMPWIDPEKEINAIEKAIKLHLMTYGQAITQMGGRLRELWAKKQSEHKLADAMGIELPDQEAGMEFKRAMVEKFASDGTVADILANATELGDLLEETGIPRNHDYVEPIVPVTTDEGATVSGAVQTDPAGNVIGGAPPIPEPVAAPVTSPVTYATPSTLNAGGGELQQVVGGGNGPAQAPPKYSLAILPEKSCATCSQLDSQVIDTKQRNWCRKFNIVVADDFTCAVWQATPIDADTNVNRGRTLPPYPAPGVAPIERNFQNEARGLGPDA